MTMPFTPNVHCGSHGLSIFTVDAQNFQHVQSKSGSNVIDNGPVLYLPNIQFLSRLQIGSREYP